MEFYTQKNVVRAKQKGNLIVFKWVNFSKMTVSDLIALHSLGEEEARANRVVVLIAETSSVVGTLTPECIDTWVNQLLPAYASVGVKYIITVLPNSSALARLSTKHWQAGVDAHGIVNYNTDSFRGAQKLAASLHKKALIDKLG